MPSLPFNCLLPLVGEQRWRRLLLALLFLLTLLLYLCLLRPQLRVVCDQACLANGVIKRPQTKQVWEKSTRVTGQNGGRMDIIPSGSSTVLKIPIACRGVFRGSRNRQVYAAVPFRIMYVRIEFLMKESCPLYPTIMSRSYNFSVGIGINEFEIRITDATLIDEIRYHFKIYRRHRISSIADGRKSGMKAFRFKQDCDFIFDPRQPCGPLEMKEYDSWSEFLQERSLLPYCQTLQLNKQDGFWMLPCTADASRCSWRDAEWHVEGCRLHDISPHDSRRLVSGRKVVFLGDSTLRGMMYSMVEKMNGSIRVWQKAHGALTLNNVNPEGRTSFLFNYFPPFEKDKQGTGICAALKLHEKQFQNQKHRMVIITGGVQWLTKTILENLKSCLYTIKSDVPVVVKGFGSGFFLPMKNLKFSPLITQKCLFRQDQRLAAISNRLGFIYLPTFNITWSRFREFHPGKCACHFHTVTSTGDGAHKIEGTVHDAYVKLLWNILYNIDSKLNRTV